MDLRRNSLDVFILDKDCAVRKAAMDTQRSTHYDKSRMPEGIYSPSGSRRQVLQPGLNIVVRPDGTVRKVMVK